ncbi:MAG: cyclic pyranopterin monophosphate synthase MoaC [Candidatus Omnitrophica bacterium]|nr:cyclic pyranopterin monophosphate synthase MoaC [Candidatus Omnitrophota bacterium]
MRNQISNIKYQISKSNIGKLEGTIDISNKGETKRVAKAEALVKLKSEVIKLIKDNKIFKGDVLENARLAGIMAAKKTHDLIPLCHPLRITDIKISFAVINRGIRIISQVQALERTGVEMEALVSCTICALTIYDMCKMYDKAIEIKNIVLLEKHGGKGGTFKRAKMES